MKLKKIFWICRQLKFDEFRIRSEIFILLEIIKNDFSDTPFHSNPYFKYR